MTDSNSKAQGPDANTAQEAVGKLLSTTRASRGLDVADVARVLRISQKYLEALEEGRNEDLPGTAYAIGFVRSYGEHLNLDGEEIVRRYKDEAEGLSGKSDLVFPKPIPDGGVPGAAVLGLGVMLAAVAYGVWYYNSNNDAVSIVRVEPVPEDLAVAKVTKPVAKVVAPAPAPVEEAAPAEAIVEEAPAVPAASAAPEKVAEPVEAAQVAEAAQTVEAVVQEATAEPAADEPAPTEVPTEAAVEKVASVEATVEATVEAVVEPAVEPVVEASPVTEPLVKAKAPTDNTGNKGPSRITVRAKSNSWIQVRDSVDDRLLFTRLLREGDEYQVPDRKGLRLMTGNAGALELLVDGEVVPAIGDVGEVRRDVELDPDKLKSGAAVAH